MNQFTNSHLDRQQLQRVLDHWHSGHIWKVKMIDGYHLVYTNQGSFVVFEFTRDEIIGPDATLRQAK